MKMLSLAIALGPAVAASLTAQAPAVSGPDSARGVFPVPSSVRVVRDVPYARYGPRELKADVYQPTSAKRRAVPGIIVVRGGGWRAGDKTAFGFIAGQLAKEGFVTASIEYRVLNEATFPAAAYDVKAAVRWMRASAATYGIDPNAIGAIGGSAGAHLVALLGTSSRVPDLEGEGGNAAVSSQIQAVVAMACPCNLESISAAQAVRAFVGESGNGYDGAVKLASPAAHVTGGSAPLLLLHSRTDPVVPFQQSLDIEALYRRANAPVLLKEIAAPDVHAFWNDARYFPETIDEAVRFLRRHLSN